MSTLSGPSATTTAGGNSTIDKKPCYTMTQFLTEACSPTERLACSKPQENNGHKSSRNGSTEVMGQYLNQWQSSWDAMGEAAISSR
ncbi:hypothetical protein J7T55_008800 [Diaporthe amygdali]|uniref:uncharacterized protein n=1 Tax=Phomopsis amygdali TaxID=1214568 RepID=UPI0022FE0D68|nr:uncharacterized protein J7T55_008800 [Diaporthe amygdali]KAJ0121633.1 hypothetical protein J7T55_008800 [Diaporthe amygdali]